VRRGRWRARLTNALVATAPLLAGLGTTGDARADSLSDLGARGRAEGYHVLLVTLDTTRADRLGCYGYDDAATETIDALTRPGIRFEQAVTPAPITLPAHASLLTGLQVPDHGARNNGTHHLEDEGVTTLAEVLRDAGYATAAFIAAYVMDARYGLDQGFEVYDDDLVASDDLIRTGFHNQRRADAVTDAALSWLDEAVTGDRPLFGWVHYFDPHQPYELDEPYLSRFEESPYDGEIAFVDDQLQRILDRLDAAGVRERTLIVVTADHGEGLGEHGETSHSRLIYDSTMRVPLILSCPSLFPDPVTVDDRLASLCDVFPTVLDLVGVPYAADGLAGRNLLALPADPERAVYLETLAPLINNGWASLHGLRRLHDKYILAPSREYYDLARDPDELRNRYLDYPDALDVLIPELDRRMAAWPSVDGAADAARSLTPEQAQRLASLGYVSGGGQAKPGEERPDPKEMIAAWERSSLAMEKSAAGHHAEALAEIEASLEANPGDAQAWHNASIIHQRMGQLPAAVAAIERAAAIYPTAERHVRLAQLLLMSGKMREAITSIEAAEVIDPSDAGILVTKGQVYAVQGRYDRAREMFEEALERDPVMHGEMARRMLQELDRVEGRPPSR